MVRQRKFSKDAGSPYSLKLSMSHTPSTGSSPEGSSNGSDNDSAKIPAKSQSPAEGPAQGAEKSKPPKTPRGFACQTCKRNKKKCTHHTQALPKPVAETDASKKRKRTDEEPPEAEGEDKTAAPAKKQARRRAKTQEPEKAKKGDLPVPPKNQRAKRGRGRPRKPSNTDKPQTAPADPTAGGTRPSVPPHPHDFPISDLRSTAAPVPQLAQDDPHTQPPNLAPIPAVGPHSPAETRRVGRWLGIHMANQRAFLQYMQTFSNNMAMTRQAWETADRYMANTIASFGHIHDFLEDWIREYDEQVELEELGQEEENRRREQRRR